MIFSSTATAWRKTEAYRPRIRASAYRYRLRRKPEWLTMLDPARPTLAEATATLEWVYGDRLLLVVPAGAEQMCEVPDDGDTDQESTAARPERPNPITTKTP